MGGQICVCSGSGSPVCTSCTSTPSSCVTDSGPAVGAACVFPFTWAGETYTSCTPWIYGGTFQGRNWCSTKTDSEGNHVNGGGNFGYCPDSCVSVGSREQ